jgi:hypothetical protein
MKVYRIENDVARYQYFLTKHEADLFGLHTDCQPKGDTWRPPEVFIYKPLAKAGDFYQFGGAGLITSPRATESLRTFLDMAGELLPLPYQGQEYTLLNVTECINCLDQERTTWLKDVHGNRVSPLQYVFHPDRFASSRLFKIPETYRGETLVVEYGYDDEEFRFVVEQAGLQGLLFRELWHGEHETDAFDEGS